MKFLILDKASPIVETITPPFFYYSNIMDFLKKIIYKFYVLYIMFLKFILIGSIYVSLNYDILLENLYYYDLMFYVVG